MRFLIIFIFLLTNSFADDVVDLKNLSINKELKKYERLPKVQLTEHIMQQYLYGTPSFLSKRYWAQSENGMVQSDRLAIVKNALKSLIPYFNIANLSIPIPNA